MELIHSLIPQSAAKRPMIKLRPKWITIHSTTDNPTTARQERQRLTAVGNKRQFSFHIAVDEQEALLCIPLNEVAYHAGDGQGDGNRASIGIVICVGENLTQALDNTAQVVADLLLNYELPLERVVQHHRWSGKNCPAILRSGDAWELFIGTIQQKYNRLCCHGKKPE